MLRLIKKYIHLKYLNTEAEVLKQLNNIVVAVHFSSTSTMPNHDTLNDIILEQLGHFEHYIEKKRHDNYLKSLQVAAISAEDIERSKQ